MAAGRLVLPSAFHTRRLRGAERPGPDSQVAAQEAGRTFYAI